MIEANRDFKAQNANLQQSVADFRELFDHVRSLPAPEALALVRNINSDNDPASLLASLRGSMHGRYVTSRHGRMATYTTSASERQDCYAMQLILRIEKLS